MRFDGFVDRQYAALLMEQRGWSGGSELSEIQENCWNRSGRMIQESRNCMSSRRFSIKGDKSTLRSGDFFQ